MISNNLALLSQVMKYNSITLQKNMVTNPTKRALRYKFSARIQQSHANLFNFTRDIPLGSQSFNKM